MDQRVRPRASLVLEKTDTIGLYAESAAMTPGGAYDVRLSIEPASRGSLPSRVVSWLGDKLGISDPAPPTRLQWSAAAGNDGRAVVAVLLYPRDDRTGDQVIVLRMTDRSTGRSAETRRIIRVGPVG
jgi:hypothetical protein